MLAFKMVDTRYKLKSLDSFGGKTYKYGPIYMHSEDKPKVIVVKEDNKKKLLTIEEASKLLNIGKNNLYTLINEGQIPVVKTSGKFLIIADKLDKWIENNEGRFIL